MAGGERIVAATGAMDNSIEGMQNGLASSGGVGKKMVVLALGILCAESGEGKRGAS